MGLVMLAADVSAQNSRRLAACTELCSFLEAPANEVVVKKIASQVADALDGMLVAGGAAATGAGATAARHQQVLLPATAAAPICYLRIELGRGAGARGKREGTR